MRGYVDNTDVEVVALVDPSPERRAQRQADWPEAATFPSIEKLAASGIEVDAVECLLPIPCTLTASWTFSTRAGTSTRRSRCATTWLRRSGSRPPLAATAGYCA